MSTQITLLKDGPLKVDGDFKLVNAEGQEVAHQGTTAYLCRCGHSAKKPFCDASHKRENFKGD